jgi:hypothetical protein
MQNDPYVFKIILVSGVLYLAAIYCRHIFFVGMLEYYTTYTPQSRIVLMKLTVVELCMKHLALL